MMRTAAPLIVVVGSVMTDLLAFTERIPGPGETLVGTSFQTGFGGKGANQAVMARLCGANVTMVCCVGQDDYGEKTLENFSKYGIGTSHVRKVDMPSGVASIWVDAAGMNRIIIMSGANNALSGEQAALAVAEGSAPDVVAGQLETPQEATAEAFMEGKRRGAVTILNPAPAADLLPDLLTATDWLIPNEVEFARITGSAGDLSDRSLRRAAEEMGCRLVVTLGGAGAALLTEDGNVRRVAAPAVTPVDTTGAGDAFVGSFSYALASGFAEDRALRVAVAVASDSVKRTGTQSSFPDPDACKILLENV